MDLKIKTCGICGKEFTCGNPISCWCSSISLTKDQLTKLKGISDDCVCPDCLSKASRSQFDFKH